MINGELLTFYVKLLVSEGTFRRIDAAGNTVTAGGQEGLLLFKGGTVCDDDFNITAAHAICKVMGFEGAISWRGILQWQIQHQFQVLTNHVKCPHPIWSTCSNIIASGCTHHEDIFLTCSLSKY